jgi:hypothetical protein
MRNTFHDVAQQKSYWHVYSSPSCRMLLDEPQNLEYRATTNNPICYEMQNTAESEK